MHPERKLKRGKLLLLKKLTEELTPDEEKELQKWADENTANRELADRVLSAAFLRHAILDKNKEKEKHAWQQFAERTGLHKRLRIGPWLQKITVAATVCLICGFSYYYYMYMDEPVIEPGSPQAVFYMAGKAYPLEDNTVNLNLFIKKISKPITESKSISPDLYTHIDVPNGGEYHIILEDSTHIHLNSGSSLYIPADFSPANRSLSLAGEAYLEVRHDHLHPFTIHTEKADIRVLGTTLNVEAYEDDPQTTVTLVKGRVEVSSGKEKNILPEGYSAVIGKDRLIHTAPADLYERTAWHDNRIVFVDRTLEDIMCKMGRWYDITPVFGNDHLRSLRITVDIDRRDTFNQLAQLLEKMNELHIRITRNKVLLSETHN